MNPELLPILAEIAWSAIKEGVKLTIEALSSKLRKKTDRAISDDKCEKIAQIINDIPDVYKLNQTTVQGYLESNRQLAELLKDSANTECITVYQTHYGSGDNVGRDKIIND